MYGSKDYGRSAEEVVISTGWSQGGVPLYINRNKSLTIGQPCSDYRKKILKDNCRMFTKTVIQNNGTCICGRKDSRLITRWNN